MENLTDSSLIHPLGDLFVIPDGQGDFQRKITNLILGLLLIDI